MISVSSLVLTQNAVAGITQAKFRPLPFMNAHHSHQGGRFIVLGWPFILVAAVVASAKQVLFQKYPNEIKISQKRGSIFRGEYEIGQKGHP